MTRFLALSRFALPGLAAALTVAFVLELALVDGVDHRAVLILVAIAAGLGLVAQPRLPFWGPAWAVAGVAAVAGIDPSGTSDLATPFFVVVLAAWCFGAYNPWRWAVAGLAYLLAFTVWIVLRFPDNGFEDALWISAFLTAAWLTGFAVSHQAEQTQRLRELAAQLKAQQGRLAEEAVEAERARIARELHDVVAHHVSVMTVQAGAVRRLLKSGQEREREALRSVEETGRKALTEMRRLLDVLKHEEAPAPLAPQPGMGTLDSLLDQVREAGLPVELKTEGEPIELPPGVDLSAYRIIQEALTNTLRHAGPAHAWVVVRYGGSNVELEIANDGRNELDNVDGHGLVGMKERVAVYGGELESGPRPGGGFAVRARLPIGTEAS